MSKTVDNKIQHGKKLTQLEQNSMFKNVGDFFSKTENSGVRKLEQPSIYAFKVKELDEANGFYAVKVGDTSHPNYLKRINQWQNNGYGTLVPVGRIDAFIDITKDDGTIERLYFRDHVFHKYCAEELGHIHVFHSDKNKDTWVSRGNKLKFPKEVTTGINKHGDQELSQALL